MFTDLLLYCILPVLTLAQNALLDETNEYRQDLWPYMNDMVQWPNELSNVVRFQLFFFFFFCFKTVIQSNLSTLIF
ncbi:unnamed protein product [Brugia pahangi]|uniref:Uncharacterized protein n=1 Tax=Brugia pahangi TaxID=6280 RepID=A0A0N4TME8_BRUPA|nr:unnamed protein product [Brugia pahangi]